ncbi:hypothetical protein PIB30_084146, partial [Stylosanthes scabra]|nr:hypothetical protein [Stylosanthes scabra]
VPSPWVKDLLLSKSAVASTAFDNQPNRFSELNAKFELKSVIYATTRRTNGDEDAVKAFAFPFSLDDKAKDWYHTLPAEVTSN